MKIATNSQLAARKANWIDFDAGALLEGTPMRTLVTQFTQQIVAIASGQPTRNEQNGYSEIAIFKNGVTL